MANNNNQGVSNSSTTQMAQNFAATQQNVQSEEARLVASLLAKKLAKEIQAEEDKERQEQDARAANVAFLKVAEAQKLHNQRNCPHMKPRNLGTALVGQRTGKGYATFVCQYCQKTFSDPAQRPEEQINNPFLYPESDKVGGPHY